MPTETAEAPTLAAPDSAPVEHAVVETPPQPAEELAPPPAEIAVETPVEQPPAPVSDMDEIETLRAQNAFYEEMFGAELVNQTQQAPAPAAGQPQAEVAPDLDAGDPLAPRTYEVTDEELHEAYMNGDYATMRKLDQRRLEVAEHNTLLKARQESANFVQWYLPVALASQSFNQRNPEFSKMPRSGEMVSSVLYGLRNQFPADSEIQLVHRAEKKLSQLIQRAKSVMQQAANGTRHQVGASQQPSGATPPPTHAGMGSAPVAQTPEEYTRNRERELAAFRARQAGR
jgi:hypothetical protein